LKSQGVSILALSAYIFENRMLTNMVNAVLFGVGKESIEPTWPKCDPSTYFCGPWTFFCYLEKQ